MVGRVDNRGRRRGAINWGYVLRTSRVRKVIPEGGKLGRDLTGEDVIYIKASM